jgi:carboxyl-terminal processing protease
MRGKARSSSSAGKSAASRRRKAGLRLYQTVWWQIRAGFYDQSRLTRWKRWRHRFDKKIHSPEDGMTHVKTMLKSLGDTYTCLLTPADVNHFTGTYQAEYAGVGADLVFRHGIYRMSQVHPNGPAKKAGLRPKDVLQAIDGKPAGKMDMVEVRSLIRGEVGTRVKLTVLRGSETIDISIVRARMTQNSVSTVMLPNNIGYIKLSDFEQKGVPGKVSRALERMKQCRGLVLDLRANEGGDHQYFVRIAALFLEKGKLMSLRGRIPGSDEKIEKVISLSRRRIVSVMSDGDRMQSRRRRCVAGRDMPLVVLVDHGSTSSAELLAAALRENGRAVLVGTKTFGKGISQGWLPVSGGATLSLSMYTAHTPSGHWMGDAQKHRFGLVPDVVVPSRGRIYISSFKRDKQLQAACALILKKRAPKSR